jgi:hypothetical protein
MGQPYLPTAVIAGTIIADGVLAPHNVQPLAVGGIAEYPQLEPEIVASTHDSPGTSALALAGLAAGSALLLSAGGWYARRRWRT